MTSTADSTWALHVPMVELVRWPTEAVRRTTFARAGIPRLLLIEEKASLPEAVGIDEDWVRLPVADEEIRARALRLRRITGDLAQHAVPYVDELRGLRRRLTGVGMSIRAVRGRGFSLKVT